MLQHISLFSSVRFRYSFTMPLKNHECNNAVQQTQIKNNLHLKEYLEVGGFGKNLQVI